MAGIHFPITADTGDFVNKVRAMKTEMSVAMKTIRSLGGELDFSTPEASIASLQKVIRDTEYVVAQNATELKRWEQTAKEAFAAGDVKTFDYATREMEEQAQALSNLESELDQYRQALDVMREAAGQSMQGGSDVPMFFKTQKDFENLQALEEKVASLQTQIANYTPADDSTLFDDSGLERLKESLTEASSALTAARVKAAEAASGLGDKLGGKAVEASTNLYTLNQAVKEQRETISDLRQRTEEARVALEELKSNGADAAAIDTARVSYETLNAALGEASGKMAALQAAQKDAAAEWKEVSQEVSLHDSAIIKMLGGYDNYKNIIGHLPGPIQTVIGSITGMTGAAKAFIATPLGAIIGVIVIALQSLRTWFDSSAEGQMAFAKVSGYVTGVLDQLKEIVITVGKAVFNAFSNPKQAVKDLWKVIKENFVNRIKGIGDMVGHLGGLLKAALTFDSDKIQSELKALANSFLQIGTGVEDATGKIGKFVKKTGEAVKKTREAAKTNSRLEVEKKQLSIDKKEKDREDKVREGMMTDARTRAMDSSKSEAARKKAMKEWERLNKEQEDADKAYQQKLINHKETKMSLTTNTIEDENELRDLKNGMIDIENRAKQRKMMMQRMNNRIDRISDKTSQNSDKAIRDIEKQEKNREREAIRRDEDFENERIQNRINLMAEGEKKVLAQQELDFVKEEQSLRRRQEDAIEAEEKRQEEAFNAQETLKAAKNKKYNKKSFSDDKIDKSAIDKIKGQYSGLFEDLAARQAKHQRDRLEAAKEAMNAYLREYGTYAEKRKAIQEQAEKDATEKTTRGERLAVLAKARDEINALTLEQLKEGGPLSGFMDGIDNLAGATIDVLISRLRALEPEVRKSLDPEIIKEFRSQLSTLTKAKLAADAAEGFFPTDEQVLKRAQAAAALYAAEMELKDLEFARANLMMEAATETDPDRKALLSTQLTDMEDALARSRANVVVLRDTLKGMGKIRFADVKDFIKGISEAVGSAEELAGCFDDDISDSVGKAAKAIGTVLTVMESVATAATRLATKTTDAIVKVADGVSTGMTASASAASGAISTIEKASAILAIIGAAIQLATMVAELFNKDKSREKAIDALQVKIDSLSRSYDRLGKAAEQAFSGKAKALMEEQAANLERQRGLIEQQRAEEQAKKKSDEKALRDYDNKIADIETQIAELKAKAEDALFGSDIKSQIEGFADAYASAWEQGENRAETARDTVRNVMREMVKESIKAAVESSGTMAEIRRNLQRMYADGVLDMVEQTEIYAMADRLQRELDERFSWSSNLLRATSEQQGASVKAWEGMSAEDAGALQGRFTAFCETSEGIRAITSGIAERVTRMESLMSGGNMLLESCLSVQINSMAHLEDISRNTRELHSMREDLSKLRLHVQSNL